MVKFKNGREDIHHRLHEALGELRKDLTRVEIWATALGSFTEPVPEYQPNEKYKLGKSSKPGPK